MSNRSDDQSRLERGEPAWGDVLPGTDEVSYHVPTGSNDPPKLFRMVAKLGAFYFRPTMGMAPGNRTMRPTTT
jgi:hypothetical protein